MMTLDFIYIVCMFNAFKALKICTWNNGMTL